MINIRCNIKYDLNIFAGKELHNAGYETNEQSHLNLFQQFINLQIRQIEQQPRRVYKAEDFSCPPEHRKGLDEFITEITQGRNLNFRLSSNLRKAFYTKDFMLSEFGLFHFHLGRSIEKTGKSKGFSKRTGPVVIAFVAEQAIYLLGIYNHSPSPWADVSLIEKIHKEWPYLIESKKLIGLASNGSYTTEQRENLRKKHVNSAIEMKDGTIYAAIRGPINAAGSSLNVIRAYDDFFIEANNTKDSLINYLKSNDNENYPIYLKITPIPSGFYFFDSVNLRCYIVKKLSELNYNLISWKITYNLKKFNLTSTSIFIKNQIPRYNELETALVFKAYNQHMYIKRVNLLKSFLL